MGVEITTASQAVAAQTLQASQLAALQALDQTAQQELAAVQALQSAPATVASPAPGVGLLLDIIA